jgi:Effector-associated domain 11
MRSGTNDFRGLKSIYKMVDENRIDSYLRFYNELSNALKLHKSSINWGILETHKDFMEKLKSKAVVFDYEVKRVQEALDTFIKEFTSLNHYFLTNYCALFDKTIDVVDKSRPVIKSGIDVAAQLLTMYLVPSAIQVATSEDLKRNLKTTYYSLVFIKKCLNDGGLLLDDIKRRDDYTFYNFVLVDKTNPKKETFSHYLIRKEQLDEYVNVRNEGKSMNIKGRYWEYSPKTDITITATKFKSLEEIERYKKHQRLNNDKSFMSSDMCVNITSQLISAKVSVEAFKQLPKPVQSIRDLIQSGKIKDALDLALKKKDISKEDDEFLMLQSARLNKLEIDNKKGVADKYTIEFNKIADAFISKINEWEI